MTPPSPARRGGLVECFGVFGPGTNCWMSPAAIEHYQRLMGAPIEPPVLAPPRLHVVPKRARQQ